MVSKAFVAVLGRARSGLAVALEQALGTTARVQVWEALPPARTVQSTEILVCDLDDVPPGVSARELASVVDRTTVLLVLGDRPVRPEWVELVAHPPVRRVRCGAQARAEGFVPVVVEVLAQLEGPSHESVVSLVLGAEPALQPVAELVRSICAAPWVVRRPRDLARVSGIAVADVKRRCTALGFRRVEHFIVCVRAVLYTRLVAGAQLAGPAARRLAGFGDQSNMRRHIKRALAHSPAAATLLRSISE